MFETDEECRVFQKKYNISDAKFRESRLTWNNLSKIASDYDTKKVEHMDTVKVFADKIQGCSYVHSLSYRVKDTEHLIEKIIRKNKQYLEKGNAISLTNYEELITDLLGIRVLLLYKEDWKPVHEYLVSEFDKNFYEEPFVHIRKGDDRSIYEGAIKIIENKPYRSAHYVVKTPRGICLEIQVRTLYEEAWSEIDHNIRYPYNVSDKVISQYIEIMNRITGVGDEMGSFIRKYQKSFTDKMINGIVDDNDVYNYILSEINNLDDENIKRKITEKIRQANNYRERKNLSDLIFESLNE